MFCGISTKLSSLSPESAAAAHERAQHTVGHAIAQWDIQWNGRSDETENEIRGATNTETPMTHVQWCTVWHSVKYTVRFTLRQTQGATNRLPNFSVCPHIQSFVCYLHKFFLTHMLHAHIGSKYVNHRQTAMYWTEVMCEFMARHSVKKVFSEKIAKQEQQHK